MLGILAMEEKAYKAGDLLNVAQTADYLNISRQRVHQLLKGNRLEGAYKIGEYWLIPFETVDNFEPQESGRPKKSQENS